MGDKQTEQKGSSCNLLQNGFLSNFASANPTLLVPVTFTIIQQLVAVFVIFTSRNEVVTKVMFLLVSVILFTEGVCLSACWDTTPQRQTPGGRHTPQETGPPDADPPEAGTPTGGRHNPGIQSMSGQYTSYWNAFLL